MNLPVGLGPGQLPWVMLRLEMLVALRAAKAKGFAVVPHEHHPVSRIDGSGAEIAFLYSHFNNKEILLSMLNF